jgi:1,4-dihydroxy-2-naphthoate octaprenyltransferase
VAGLRELILVTRPWSFAMTVIVSAAAAVYAYYLGYSVDVGLTLAAVLGLILLHASVNLANDYFDYRSGVDRPGVGTVEYRPHPVVHGILGPGGTLAYAVATGLAGLAIGLLITLQGRPLAIALGLAGAAIGWAYTATPVSLKYRGLGEAAVALAFGPLMFLGVFYVATGALDPRAAAASLPLGVLIASVLLANNIRDVETDAKAGVRTIAVMLGRRGAMRLFKAMIAFAYASTAVMAVSGLLPLASLATLATAPMALKIVREAEERGPPPDFDPRVAKLVTAYGAALVASMALQVAAARALR